METHEETEVAEDNSDRDRLREVAGLFLKLGIIGFGGPAAHIALMRNEVVDRRRWLPAQQFLDLMGASNLIPGPSSTELGMFLGNVRAGRRGLLVAGACFITPAMLIVLALAWAYARYGGTPGAAAVLSGVKPVIIAVILQALWTLGRTAVKNVWLALIGAAVVALYFVNVSPIAEIFGAGILVMLAVNARRLRPPHSAVPALLLVPGAVAAPSTLWTLFLTFLKIGVVTYGSGYVLLAFLHTDVVNHFHWLTNRQLLDAVAVGQITPGPVFTTATFIGYQVGGVPGALLATLGIFIPSFALAALIYPFVPRLRASAWAGAFLDGVNVAALGLMAAVTWQLGRAAILDVPTALLAIAAVPLLVWLRINSVWLVCGAVLIGLAKYALMGGGL